MVFLCSRRAIGTFSLLSQLLFLSTHHAESSELPPPVLNPKTYTSPSGVYSLLVNPIDILGRGSATYLFSKGGVEVWTKVLPVTLWDAGITDKGLIAGYGYTLGWRGFGEGDKDEGSGQFQVLILDANGDERFKEVKKRNSSRFLHTPPNPIANGLIVDGPNDRMVVRVHDPDVNRGVESWWVYGLSTGEALAKLQPAKRMADSEYARFVIDAKPIVSTPLTLVHWWRYEQNRLGARFTLVDLKAEPVWSLELKEDYNIPGDEKEQDKLMHFIRERGAILRADQEGQFQLHFAAESQKVTFSVKRTASEDWAVTEVGRVPYTVASSNRESPTVPDRPLKSLGQLVLQARNTQSNSEIRNVADIEVDGKGRIAFLREEDSEPASFIVVEQSGKELHKVRLDVGDDRDAHWTGYSWVGGNQFILTRSEFGVGGMAKAWRVDVKTRKVSQIPGFDCPAVESLAGFADGSFVALATLRQKYSSETTVYGFDVLGKRTWTLEQDYGNTPGRLFSPKDVTVTSTGEVAVLDVIRHNVQFFDRRGKYLRVIDLAKSWRREPNYPSGISADTEGGILVYDFDGSPPYVRMNQDGSVRMDFQSKFDDGRIADSGDVRVAPNGRLWTSDGHSILRLKDSGVVDRVLGQPPNVDLLSEVAALTIDRRGQIYAVDSRTGTVHVFDKNGRFLHACKPDPTDFSKKLWNPAITVSDEGQVYLSLEDAVGKREGDYLRFSAKGERLGIVNQKTDRWYIQPGTGNGLALDYEEAYLIASGGQKIHTISRRPDGNWLERPYRADFARNGSFAIAARTSRLADVSVNLYRSDGEPNRTIEMPGCVDYPNIAYDGERLVAAGFRCLVVFDDSGKEIQRFSPGAEGAENVHWHPFLIPEANELVVFDGSSTTLYRYKMP